MAAPLIGIGAAARMAAKKLAERMGKKEGKEKYIDLMERQAEKEAAKKALERKENIKEGIKTVAKTTAKTAGGAGAVGAAYLAGEGLSPSGKGPVTEAISRKLYEKEEEPVKKKTGGMVSSASKRADGIAKRGRTHCKIC